MKLNDERLSADEVRQIAALARISMNDEEIEIMRGQMVNILNNIDAVSYTHLTLPTTPYV